jgi:hypothetical protein
MPAPRCSGEVGGAGDDEEVDVRIVLTESQEVHPRCACRLLDCRGHFLWERTVVGEIGDRRS